MPALTKHSTLAAALAAWLICLGLACAAEHGANLPDGIGPNLALGKTFKSSDINQSGWDAGLTDGVWNSEKRNTYATGRSAQFPKTVTMDLEKLHRVAFVRIGVPRIGSTKTIEVSLSEDGASFKPAGRHDFQMEVENSHIFEFAPVAARYVRLNFIGNHARRSNATRPFPTEYCFVSEVEVYGPSGSGRTVHGQADTVDTTAKAAAEIAREQAAAITTRLPANLGPNLAVSKPWVSSDPNPSNWDAGLTDGFWLMRQGHTFATGNTKTFPKTVTIDLKTSAYLTHVHFGAPDFGSTKTVSVSVSYDGKKFTEVGRHDFQQGRAESRLFSFEPVLSRHVRLTCEANHDNKLRFDPAYCFTTEVEVYAQPRR